MESMTNVLLDADEEVPAKHRQIDRAC